MGGLGSGRPRSRLAVGQCRALDIRELAAADGLRRPFGELLWRDERSGKPRGLLAYRLTAHSLRAQRAGLLALYYFYWPDIDRSSWQFGSLEVARRPGLPAQAGYPGLFCERSVRRLYAPPGASSFGCRSCLQLVDRPTLGRPRPAQLAALAAEVAAACEGGPLPAGEQLPARGPQERRLSCLRYGAAGLSLRVIAARLGCSKSSVGRILAAGPGGVDLRALYGERRQRGIDELRLYEELSAVGRPASDATAVGERMLLFRKAEAIQILRRKSDDLLVHRRLVERARRRRSLEMRRYRSQGG
jgi:transposase